TISRRFDLTEKRHDTKQAEEKRCSHGGHRLSCFPPAAIGSLSAHNIAWRSQLGDAVRFYIRDPAHSILGDLAPMAILLLAFFTSLLGATEITTGFLLGPKYDHRAFYIRYRPGEAWQKTYSG